ncbi:integral membrane protein [Aspergillus eucalypticola CBS 122712]|uniref:Integral membrane protein n=1 Tax=Aspergillus eucalypticola (strain CBS 122712 / IBT 29274) TaxID=1448314 RepID=A0A317VRR7_ASPEC|nr:uncharacterized protein BO83DRAFT_377487 [Aspergillus eucalypticola CBS 122712]PWY75697.1 integral membrane protein [Aspergillus eucalypticola CBS 122712]
MANFWCLRHMRPSISSPHPTGLLFCLLGLLYLLSIGYYRSTSHRDPTSFFFDPSRAYEKRYSAHRIQEAKSFLTTAGDFPSAAKPSGNTQATICVGIVTVRRRKEQYVGLTIASLLEGLTESERNTIFLDLLIAHTDPFVHPIFSEKWVETLPDRVLLYLNDDNPDYEQIRAWEDGGWYRNKTIYDFTHLMKDCYETGADYVAMIEDDTLAAKGWLSSTLHALDVIQQRTIAGQDWVYLRLFYIDDLLGWNSEEWPRYLAFAFLFWAALTGAIVSAKKRFFKSTPASAICMISFCFIPAFIGLHFMAGRQTMWPFRPGVHEMNKYGCCSQGLVFPRSIVPRFLEHTDLTTDWLVDMMVEKIANRQGWKRYVIVPPVLQHIGATSSKGYGFDKSAKTIWNFRYEEYPY